MNHFFIITNRDKDMDLSTTNEIKHFLQKKGKTCRMRSGGGSRNTLGGRRLPAHWNVRSRRRRSA